jgi:hypothetical protein
MIRKSSLILLLLAVIPLLIFVPGSKSQSFTTITNLSTVTTRATFNQASQYAVATTTVTSAVSESIYDSQFVQTGVGIRYCYIAAPISFDAIQGQQVQGTIQSRSPNSLAVYLMSDQQLRIWSASSPRYCDPSESGQHSILSSYKVTSYVLDWTVPEDGKYWLVIETYCAFDCTVTASLAKHYSQTVVSTSYSTQTSLLVITATQSLTSISTQLVATPGSFQPNNTLTLSALGVVIAVALAVGFFVFSRRKQKKV